MEAVVFSPSHITGFFSIVDQPKDALCKGSTGAGVSLSLGVKSRVRVMKSGRRGLTFRMNGRISEPPDLVWHIVKSFVPQQKGGLSIIIDQDLQLPIGSGFGVSGASALSVAMALNEALATNLSKEGVARIAHAAEIGCKTGLGTVIAETYGGLEVRVRAGAPGIGEIRRFPVSDSYSVVCLTFGPISTPSILKEEGAKRRVNKVCKGLVDRFVANPRPEAFLKISREFSDEVNLSSHRLMRVLMNADAQGFTCSMAMVGESLFSIVKSTDVEELVEVFKGHMEPGGRLFISTIDKEGVKIL